MESIAPDVTWFLDVSGLQGFPSVISTIFSYLIPNVQAYLIIEDQLPPLVSGIVFIKIMKIWTKARGRSRTINNSSGVGRVQRQWH